MHEDSRRSIARAAAGALRARSTTLPCLVGFDGFVDEIIHVVSQRRSMQPRDYDRIATITEFSQRCAKAANKSANLELVSLEQRFGGNGPLMAGALGRLGGDVCYIGAIEDGHNTGGVMPLFEPFAQRCREVIPVAAPAHTDAMEFEDGKLMFGRTGNVQEVTFERLIERVGIDGLIRRFEAARLIGMVNWSLCGGVPSIWQGLIERVLPALSEPRSRRVFIDLSDPAKRTDDDLRDALELLQNINAIVPVTLGLNLSESERIAAVLGVHVVPRQSGRAGVPDVDRAITETAESIRARLGLSCVVIHPREGAAAASETGELDWFDGPFVRHPRLSTGAGDHFNAGFAFAQTLGLPLVQCLACATAVSGAYVRDAESPTLDRLLELLEDLPGPERSGDSGGM